MKKVLFTLAAILGLGFVLVATSCGGGGTGSGDDDDVVASTAGFVLVPSGTVIGGNKFILSGETANNFKGAFISGRSVTISQFYICDHEVTQEEYETYCTYTGSYSPSANPYGDNRDGVGNRYPVYYVSWYDALVYCNRRSIAEGLAPCYMISGKTNPDEWGTVPTSGNANWNAVTCNFNANGYRLPTEVEWEYAARGGSSGCYVTNPTDYAGTDDSVNLGAYAWYFDNTFAIGFGTPAYGSHPVKTKTKNALNIYDMSGNVYEWCWDWYGTINEDTMSTGASTGYSRILRGGCWMSGSDDCSVAYRFYHNPYTRSWEFGFRVVRSAE